MAYVKVVLATQPATRFFKMKISRTARTTAAAALAPLNKGHHEGIDMSAIQAALAAAGLIALQEDGTAWQGFFCGREGSARIALGQLDSATPARWNSAESVYTEIDNSLLILTWYKISTKYEIVAYLS